MRKAVLISIKPEWCELIVNGKKTVEVRKNKPKLETPFKCYIYCTKAPKGWFWFGSPNFRRDGVVIGEFVCKMITPIAYTTDGLADVVDCDTACMEPLDFIKYGKGKPLYAWHISELKIYDKPKELSEFSPADCGKRRCFNCECFDAEKPSCTLKRPPQSWWYVEEREDNAKGL